MKVQDFVSWSKEVSGSSDGNCWHPVRLTTSENTFLILRIKAAWRVLTGEADALDWE